MTRTRARAALNISMRPPADLEAEPCTPVHDIAPGFPRALPVGAMPSASTSLSSHSGASDSPRTPDIGSLALLTPSTVEEDMWAPEEVEVLESLLARPPDPLHFAPGSMPPPHVLDELASVVLGRFSEYSYDASAEPSVSPSASASVSREWSPSSTGDVGMDSDHTATASWAWSSDGLLAPRQPAATQPQPQLSQLPHDDQHNAHHGPDPDTWPHSWDETRRKLAALALSDTRLGAERAERKLTRQERLARPGPKRVGSMDFLDEVDEAKPSEQLGRVLRLSTTLQNSTRDTPELTRAASLGGRPRRTGSALSSLNGMTSITGGASPAPPPSSFNAPSSGSSGTTSERPSVSPRPFALTITPANDPSAKQYGSTLGIGAPPMRRQTSTRSAGSSSGRRRPSLLARGRSFTASDLEAEEARAGGGPSSENLSWSGSASVSGSAHEGGESGHASLNGSVRGSTASMSPAASTHASTASMSTTSMDADADGEGEGDDDDTDVDDTSTPRKNTSTKPTIVVGEGSPASPQTPTKASFGSASAPVLGERPEPRRSPRRASAPGNPRRVRNGHATANSPPSAFTPTCGRGLGIGGIGNLPGSTSTRSGNLGGPLGGSGNLGGPLGGSLGGAFEPNAAPPRRAAGWDSDSDTGIVIKRARKRGSAIAMAAMAGAAGLVLDTAVEGGGGLRSPFEEKTVELK